VAFDQSHSAFEHCQRRAAEVKYPERVRFVNHDFTRIDPAGYPDVDAVYSRFTLHSVDAEAEARVLDVAWRLLGPGGQLLLEARTVNDPLYGKGTEVGRHEFITDHYRRHIDAQELLTSVLERGFLLHFFHESDGLAVYQDEDPVVVRMALLRP
jgi:SAM-dependent methyltransferase